VLAVFQDKERHYAGCYLTLHISYDFFNSYYRKRKDNNTPMLVCLKRNTSIMYSWHYTCMLQVDTTVYVWYR